MDPYYQDGNVTLFHGDAFDVTPTIEAGSVDAVITDPPYNIGKAHWDNIPDYQEWNNKWITQASNALKPEGAFWVFHSDPLVLANMTKLIGSHDRKMVSWITLDKSSWGMARRYKNAGTKSFPASVEYASYSRREVYAEQIKDMRERNNMTRAQFDTMVSPSRKPTGITYRWEHGERVPQEEEVRRIESIFGTRVITPTFNNPQKHQTVWQFPQTDTTDHPTPKPIVIMERIISTTTNQNDVVLDPFAGSGSTLVAARNLGRKAIGVELEERYCEIIANRLAQGALDLGI